MDRRVALGALLSLHAGCAAPTAQEFAACFVDALDPSSYYDSSYYSRPWGGAFAGTVTAAEVGVPPEDCFHALSTIGPAYDFDDSEATWVRLADPDAAERLVAFWFPDGLAPPEVGEVLEATLSYSFGGFSASTGRIELSRDGELYAYVAASPTIGGIEAPAGHTIADGGVAGSGGSACGRWKYHDLLVDGATVPYGARATVGAFDVRHGGYQVGAGGGGQCLDWSPDYVAVGITGSN